MKKNIEPLFIGLNECDPDIEYIRALVECENGDHEKELSILVNVFHESRESKERTKCALFILIAFTCSSHHLDQKYLRDLVLDRLSQIDCDYFIQKLIERVNQRNSKNKWIEDVKKLVFRERYTFYDNMEYFCCDVVELVEACNDKRPSEQIESLLPKLYLRLAAKFSDDIKKENLDKANRYYETKETSLSLDEKIFYFVQMTTVGADQLILKSMSNLKDVIKSMKEKIEDNSLLIEQPFQFQEARLYEALSQAAARSGKHTKRERNRLKAIRRFAEMDENLKSYLEQSISTSLLFYLTRNHDFI